MARQIIPLADAGKLLSLVLVDKVQLYTVGPPVTTGIQVTRQLTPLGEPVDGLVQTTLLANAVESLTETTWSVKVAAEVPLQGGMAVQVLMCQQDPSLVGEVLLIDRVNQSGMNLIRKGVSGCFMTVDQQGKAVMAR